MNCSCGKVHETIPASAVYQDDPYMGGWYFNCTCGSTMFVQVEKEAA